MLALAAGALPIASLLLGAWLRGLRPPRQDDREARPGAPAASRTWTLVRLLVVILGSSLILIEPALIEPLPVQYILLIAVPLVLGFAVRALLERRLSAIR